MWNKHLFMSREQIREYDRVAIEEMGIPGPVLMENAGRGAANAIAGLLKKRPGSVGILAGPGNNGGDGYVIARHLLNRGEQVVTYLAVPRGKLTGDAKINFDILEAMGGEVVDITGDVDLGDVVLKWRHHAWLVDALLGTGVTRDVAGRLGDIIDRVNSIQTPVIAVDIPSGMDADTGRPWQRAVQADATMTFGHFKRGLVQYPGKSLAGDISVVPIGVPGPVSETAGFEGAVLSKDEVVGMLPVRPADGHKGTFGHLLVVGGLPGKTGAAAMAGDAAMRIGTGLVTVGTSSHSAPALEAKSVETMVQAFLDEPEPAFEARMASVVEGKQAVALGPGLSTDSIIAEKILNLLESLVCPVVVDADGLNILAASRGAFERISAPLVLTPHPGEMARLVKLSVRDVQADRLGVARELAASRKAVVVLKGAATVIAAPDGRLFVNPTGNSGMGCGGMGDVLTGIIGGFLAQGAAPLDAACIGAFLHGLAGDRAAETVGADGLVASDVIRAVPGVLSQWRRG